MIEISTLPKEPIDAFQAVISTLMGIKGGNASLNHLLQSNHEVVAGIHTALMVGNKAAARVDDPLLHQATEAKLKILENDTLDSFKGRMGELMSLTVAMKLDEHFLSETDVADFENADLTSDEKGEIRELMAKARKLTEDASFLSDDHKRRICFRISKVENELFKEKAKFGAFMAAAYEVSGLVKQFGEDAQPIAEAIQKSRTITEQKIEGHLRIEEESKPKRITDQSTQQ